MMEEARMISTGREEEGERERERSSGHLFHQSAKDRKERRDLRPERVRQR